MSLQGAWQLQCPTDTRETNACSQQLTLWRKQQNCPLLHHSGVPQKWHLWLTLRRSCPNNRPLASSKSASCLHSCTSRLMLCSESSCSNDWQTEWNFCAASLAIRERASSCSSRCCTSATMRLRSAMLPMVACFAAVYFLVK